MIFLPVSVPQAEHNHAENEPWQPGARNFSPAVTVGGAMFCLFLFTFEGPNSLGMPHHQEGDQADHRDHGGDDVHQPRSVMVGHEILRGREGRSGHQDCRPDFDHLGESHEGPDQPERHQQREKRQDASRHCTQGEFAESRNRGQGDDRRAQRAVRYRSGIGDQRQSRCLQRLEAQSDQERGGDSHRSSESRSAFKECSEAEGDQQKLQPTVLGDSGQTVLQNFEASGFHRELIQEDDIQHDPSDGKQPVGQTVDGSCPGQCARACENQRWLLAAPSRVRRGPHSVP